MKEGQEKGIYPPGLHKERESYSTIPLKNEVIWVNEDLHAPFAFTVGESSPLGLMFSTMESAEKGLALTTRAPGHGRSADIAPVYFKDPQGKLYRDIDIKGAGAVSSLAEPTFWKREYMKTGPRMRGLLNKEDALHDAEIAEKFNAFGIRTHRTVAIIELNELELNGEAIAMTDLQKGELLLDDFVPVVQIRAYGTKTRIQDLMRGPREKELADAIALVSQETKGEVTDAASYILWFARTLGTNVGRMHKHGYCHGYLSRHNITLDCRLTDFDSVETRESFVEGSFLGAVNQDIFKAELTLQSFLLVIDSFKEDTQDISLSELEVLFEKAYAKENPGVTEFS